MTSPYVPSGYDEFLLLSWAAHRSYVRPGITVTVLRLNADVRSDSQYAVYVDMRHDSRYAAHRLAEWSTAAEGTIPSGSTTHVYRLLSTYASDPLV